MQKDMQNEYAWRIYAELEERECEGSRGTSTRQNVAARLHYKSGQPAGGA